MLCALASATLLPASDLAADVPKGLIELEPKPAPALRLENLDGRAFDLSQARGGWAIVHFWASWCGPCRREMPTVEGMAQALADRSVTIVLVNTAENEDAVFSFMSVVAPGLDTLMDYDGSVTERWQPRGLPSTFLVDPAGRLRFVALGGRTWDSTEYLTFLRALVDEP
jgi:thiol-disulfide isomerase/thioredoxin